MSLGKIVKIQEWYDFESDQNNGSKFDGYIITTDSDTIKIGICNSQQCCESWGYLSSEDNLEKFIGSNLNDILVVDNALKVYQPFREISENDAIFVNLLTNRGTLQFVVYNEHNGYYGHRVIVESKTFNLNSRI